MKKRVITFLLAAMLICNMVPETLYAMENVPAGQETGNGEAGTGEKPAAETDACAGESTPAAETDACAGENTPAAETDHAGIAEPIEPDGTDSASGKEGKTADGIMGPAADEAAGIAPKEQISAYEETDDVSQYQVQYDANGGTGTMASVSVPCGTGLTLTKHRFKREGYSFAGWNTKSDGTGTSYSDGQTVPSLSGENGAVIVLYAIWEGYPYRVKYDKNGAESGDVSGITNHVYGTPSPLAANTLQKKGYQAAGWSTEKNGGGKVYASGEMVTDLTTRKNSFVTLYARWEKNAVYKITYNCDGGKLPGSVKKTYTIETETYTLPAPTKSGYDFDGWYTEQTFTNRIGEIKQGNTGDLMLYAKWVKCSGKISKKIVKITSCKATGTNKISVQAKVKKRVASSDDYYYLVYVNPMSGKAYKMAEKTYKKDGKISYTLDTSKNRGFAIGKFGVAVKKGKKYYLISNVSYVKNPEKAAENKSKYKAGKTKKGIQFTHDVKDMIDCNAKQVMMNLPASEIFTNAKVPYKYNGKTYYFNSMSGYQEIVRECNRKNINVTVKILLNRVNGHTDLICKSGRSKKNATYYMWNVYDDAAREKMEAIFSYLGMLFGQEDCYISNWILGNEVNNYLSWNYAGNISQDKYFKAYAQSFRSLYFAVRSQCANAHIFICTDHVWNIDEWGAYGAKKSLSSFKKQLDSIQKGIKWNLAFHAYSQPLTNTAFWNGTGITNNENTDFITMKNLNVLTNYIKKHYGSSVRVHLSELGYSSSGSQEEQAAAIAYSYYIAACNPMVDAITIRSYKDNPIEAAQGLSMGIKGKEAFSVFKYMDTAKSEQYTKKYLKTIKAGSWKSIVPGYQKSRITKMYRK